MRAAPTVEDEFCALANYKSVRNREIVHIKMKGHSSNKMRTRMAASFDASLATVPLVELGLHNDDLAVMDTKPVEFKDPVSESDNLLMALGRQYHTPALANSLAQLQSLASACTEYVHLQATPVDLDKMNLNEEIIVSDAPIAPSFIAHLDDVHNPRHIDVILLVKTDTEDVDGCGFKLFPVHSFILRSRCYFLAQRLKTQSITTGVSETNSNKSLNVINIIDLVPPSCVHLFPLLVRFLYEDSAVDAEVDHSNLQASGPSFSGICLNMVRQFCLKRLLNQPSSSFLQYGNQLGDGQVNDWLEMSADEVLWRSDGIATELVNTLEMVCRLYYHTSPLLRKEIIFIMFVVFLYRYF